MQKEIKTFYIKPGVDNDPVSLFTNYAKMMGHREDKMPTIEDGLFPIDYDRLTGTIIFPTGPNSIFLPDKTSTRLEKIFPERNSPYSLSAGYTQDKKGILQRISEPLTQEEGSILIQKLLKSHAQDTRQRELMKKAPTKTIIVINPFIDLILSGKEDYFQGATKEYHKANPDFYITVMTGINF